MLEADLEREVIRWAESVGGYAAKLKEESKRGFPDRTIFLPDACVIFPELKLPARHKKYRQQVDWIQRLERLGFAAGFCETLEEVQDLWEIAKI